MKKKLLTLLLALVLVVTVTAISVMAEETTPAVHEHCICGDWCDGRGNHVCADSGDITWTPFTLDVCEEMSDGRLIIPSGNYYLAEDLKTDKAFVILPETEVSICLNGKTLESSSRVFRVHGTLNIAECTNGTGKVIGTNGGQAPVFYIGGHGHINHYRGILRASQDTKNYGGVGAIANDTLIVGDVTYVAERAPGSMTMYGGTLDASKVTLTKTSAGEHGSGGALIIFGNAAAPASFTQYGGTIKGAKSVAVNGAAIYAPSTATVQLLGGNIESGKAKNLGDGVYANKGCALTVGGAAQIEDLYVPGGQTFTTQNLTGSVGLTVHPTNSAVLTTAATADEAAKFTSNTAGRNVIVTESEGTYQVSLGGHNAHCECGGNLTGVAAENHTCAETTPEWTALTAENIVRDAGITVASDRETDSAYNMFAQSGHYYLTESITLDKVFEIRPGQNITLCLNGYTLSTNYNQSIFRMTGGTLNICDCTGKGTMKSSKTATASLVYLLNGYADAAEGVTFNLYGGNLTATGTSTSANAGAIQLSNNNTTNPCVMNMYGGTLTGCSRKSGGTIYMVNSVAATLNIYGGTITGGTANTSTGGNINCTSGTINMYAGTISGGTATTAGGNIYLSVVNASEGRGAKFNMYGGTVTGGTAGTQGGNIYMNAIADVTTFVAECNIQNGTVTNGSANNRGGNIFINRGYFTMNGGTVTGGSLTTHDRGLDIGMGANPPVSLTVDGEVKIGEIGVFGDSSDTFAIHLGENFSTKTPIAIQSANLSKVIANTDAAMLKCFTATNANAQLTFEDGDIWMRSADDHYACRCGGAHIGTSYHGSCDYVKWTALTLDVINGYTYQETTETTDETTGETITTTTDVVVPGFETYTHESKSAALAGDYLVIPGGSYYYLTEDLTLDQALYLAADTTAYIDLNGHTLTAGESAMRAFLVNGNLNICDSSYNAAATTAEDKFQGGIVGTREISYNVLYVGMTGTVRIFGGDIATAVAQDTTGQGPVGISGKLYLFDGTITGTKVTGSGGTIVLNDGGGFLMYNGKVSGGSAMRGGNIFIGSGYMTMHDGQIVGGHAYGSATGSNGGGGNIYAAGNVTIRGGTISGGIADRTQSKAQAYGGNIYSDATDKYVKIYGGAIDGGSAVTGGNIFVRGTFEMTDGTISNGIATDAIGGNVRVEGNIANATGVCNITGGTFIGGTAKQQGGSLILRNLPGEIIIKDASFTGGISTDSHGGNIYMVGIEGNVVMENVTIADGVSANRGGNLYITAAVEGVTANLTNVTMTGGQAAIRGGNMYVADVDCTMTNCTVTGGAVTGNEENTIGADLFGANIATNTGNYATSLTIDGGNYGGLGENNICLTSVHILSSDAPYTVTVTGAPVIDDLRLGTDRMLTVGELTEGANIGISRFEITGLFASGAAEYAQYFTGVNEGTSVAAEGEDLVLVSSMPYWAFDALDNVIAPANTIAEAMALENASFIRLVSDCASTETYTGDLYLDLYGHDLSGLTVNGNLYVVDYATNDYEEDVAGSFSGTVSGTINDGKVVYSDAEKAHFNTTNTYVKIANEDGSYGFHRVSVSITHVSLKAADDALGFKATISGDSAVQAAVTGFGFNMGVKDGNLIAYTKTAAPTDGTFTMRVKNIMKMGGGEIIIVGQPVLYFGEELVEGTTYGGTTMRKTIEAVEAALAENAEAYTKTQIESVQALIAQYESKMSGWDIDTIKAWVAPSTDTTESETTV